MSKFVTKIPVDVAAVVERLPAGKTVTGMAFDTERREVLVYWEHDQLVTPYTVQVDWPPDSGVNVPVQHRQIVKDRRGVAAAAVAIKPEPAPKATKPARGR